MIVDGRVKVYEGLRAAMARLRLGDNSSTYASSPVSSYTITIYTITITISSILLDFD